MQVRLLMLRRVHASQDSSISSCIHVKSTLHSKYTSIHSLKMASPTDPEFSLKLIIDPKSRRIPLAVARKEVVDFIFSLLYMPMASIVKLLAKEQMVWSMDSIYGSVDRISEAHLEHSQAKSLILSPTFVSPSKLLTGSSTTMITYGKYYRCMNYSNCGYYCTDMNTTLCPNCKIYMATELKYVGSSSGRVAAEAAISTRGFAKGTVAYTVTDDLTVMPLSNATGIALLNKFGIKDVSLLEERTVKFGKKEGLELLKASLKSKTVLTDVFLRMKAETQE